MNGGYDPVTPLAYGEAAAAAAQHALPVRVPDDGPRIGVGRTGSTSARHPSPSSSSSDPAIEPDSSCIAAMPPTDFLTTDDIYPTTAIYRFNSDVVQDRDPVQIGIAVVSSARPDRHARLRARLRPVLAHPPARRCAGAAPCSPPPRPRAVPGVRRPASAFVLVNTDPLILAFGHPAGGAPAGHRAAHRDRR